MDRQPDRQTHRMEQMGRRVQEKQDENDHTRKAAFHLVAWSRREILIYQIGR